MAAFILAERLDFLPAEAEAEASEASRRILLASAEGSGGLWITVSSDLDDDVVVLVAVVGSRVVVVTADLFDSSVEEATLERSRRKTS